MPINSITALKMYDNVCDIVKKASGMPEDPISNVSRNSLNEMIHNFRRDSVAIKMVVEICSCAENRAEITYNISGKNERAGDIEPEIVLHGQAAVEFYRQKGVKVNPEAGITVIAKRDTALFYFGGKQ